MANREREIQKFLHPPNKEELKIWTDKIYARFPVLPNWNVGVFFGGAISVGQQVPRWIVPEQAWGFIITHLKVTYQTGTLTGDTTIDVSHLSKGRTALLGTLELATDDVADAVISIELAHPVSLQTDDLIKWDCTAAGGHAAVTAFVVGRQKS